MQSAGLRHRNRSHNETDPTSEANPVQEDDAVPANAPESTATEQGLSRPIPSYTVDLSLPPQDRYTHVAAALLPHIHRANLTDLFDDLINQLLPGLLFGPLIKRSAPLLLRRVYDDEENAELKGIATATSLPMYLLVAFNVLLDLLLGCTSGGVQVEKPAGQEMVEGPDGRMVARKVWKSHIVHFRTLDWGMDPLRELIVELNYVRSAGGPVVATTVGYFGYVGVLTGVRKGLSMSLNFRPRHGDSSLRKRIDFRRHQLMVILGLRPSISSVLRRYLLNQPEACPLHKSKGQRELRDAQRDSPEMDKAKPPFFDIKTIMTELSSAPSTSAYLIFCTPDNVYSVEKDNHVAFVRTSSQFLTTYNHDASDEKDPSSRHSLAEAAASKPAPTGMEQIVEYSTARKHVLDKIYERCLRRRRKKFGRDTGAVELEDVFRFLGDRDRWIVNDETHYAVIMDPQRGTVLWKSAYVPAVEESSEVEEPDA